MSSSTEDRVTELEIRSEERRADVQRLQDFVAGYEARIAALERQLKQLLEDRSNPQGDLPPADQDLPPHY